MKIEFCEKNKSCNEVITMLKENHPEYETKVQSCLGFCEKCQDRVIAKIGDDFIDAPEANELYEKIIDHFFRIPNCYIG